MLQIAICDDDIKDLEEIYEMTVKYRENHPELDIMIRRFQSSYDLLEAISARGRFDIYLLDILMPNTDGLTAASAIREKDSAAALIFLTCSPEYALESYEVKAQGYLLKPFTEKNLFDILDYVADWLDAGDLKRFVIHTAGGAETVPFGSLLYVEYYKHRLIAHLTDESRIESILYRESFEQLAAPLTADGRFIKTSASHVVNMQHIRRITSRQITLSNDETLTISRVYANARNTYLDYVLNMGVNNSVSTPPTGTRPVRALIYRHVFNFYVKKDTADWISAFFSRYFRRLILPSCNLSYTPPGRH